MAVFGCGFPDCDRVASFVVRGLLGSTSGWSLSNGQPPSTRQPLCQPAKRFSCFARLSCCSSNFRLVSLAVCWGPSNPSPAKDQCRQEQVKHAGAEDEIIFTWQPLHKATTSSLWPSGTPTPPRFSVLCFGPVPPPADPRRSGASAAD